MQINPFNINVVQIKSFCYIWFKNWCLKYHRHYLQDCWKTHRGGLQTMIYTAIDTFYLTDEQLENSPSRKDGIDEATERTLRIYGCDLIQECGILLRLPQAVMATAQVLFHRFYCKKSFVRFNVKRVAVSCVWLASKLEESPRKARHILIVFHRMECRRENLPIQHLDPFSKKYADLKMDLNRTERHLLKEMAFICHVEHPHKFISNYLNSLGGPAELRQEAWNLANDSLRTTLCVRFKSEVVACGVIYIAARKNGVPLPENPPWWLAFDAEKSSIDEVCRVLARLYSLPKAQYLPVCRDGGSFTMSNKSWDSPSQLVPKEGSLTAPSPNNDSTTSKASNAETSDSKGVLSKLTVDKSKEPKKNDESETVFEGEARADPVPKIKHEHRREASGERNKDSARERERDRGERQQSRDRDRGKDSDRERENDVDRDRSYRISDKGKDSGGLSEKLKQRLSRDRDYYESSHSRDKKRHRHH